MDEVSVKLMKLMKMGDMMAMEYSIVKVKPNTFHKNSSLGKCVRALDSSENISSSLASRWDMMEYLNLCQKKKKTCKSKHNVKTYHISWGNE